MIYWKDIKSDQDVRDTGRAYKVGKETVYWKGKDALKAKSFLMKRTKDTDGDKVPDYRDCKPYDPKRQDLVSGFALGAGASFVGSQASKYYEQRKMASAKKPYWK